MSGGVDSSAAALLMQGAGWECVGCTMKLFDGEADCEGARSCCSLSDVEDARSVARRLGMPYYVFNFKDAFRAEVIEPFIESYRRGMTPNPCLACNGRLKFEKLFARAAVLGCGCVVTGHYARIEEEGGRFLLKKARDATKDQSYVLYMLRQEQLRHLRFPLGKLAKAEVRALAEAAGFANAQKPDSQDICFVPDGDYAAAIERFTGCPAPPGDFVDERGNVLGRHRGIIRYTVGQRRGLGIAAKEPLYVKAIDAAGNRVILGGASSVYSSGTMLDEVNWVSGETPAGPVRASVRVRYRGGEQPALVIPEAEGGARILFEKPQRAVTPGQAAVFYDGEIVLGGGRIRFPIID